MFSLLLTHTNFPTKITRLASAKKLYPLGPFSARKFIWSLPCARECCLSWTPCFPEQRGGLCLTLCKSGSPLATLGPAPYYIVWGRTRAVFSPREPWEAPAVQAARAAEWLVLVLQLTHQSPGPVIDVGPVLWVM